MATALRTACGRLTGFARFVSAADMLGDLAGRRAARPGPMRGAQMARIRAAQVPRNRCPSAPESVPKCPERAPRSGRNRCPSQAGIGAQVRPESVPKSGRKTRKFPEFARIGPNSPSYPLLDNDQYENLVGRAAGSRAPTRPYRGFGHRPQRAPTAHPDPGRESLRTRPARGPGSAPAITFLPSNANAILWIGLAPTARSSAA